jgi:hypothetical protein
VIELEFNNIALRLNAALGHHSGIDTRGLKVRIVDHGRFKGRRGIAYVRNEDRIAIDHSCRLLTLPQFGTSNGVLNAAIDVHA